jgi:uncharacterized membrane protein YraQ (UPF0718 family)
MEGGRDRSRLGTRPSSTPDGTVEKKVNDFIIDFTSIIYEALPFIVLGAVLAGILEELLPQRLITRLLPRSRTLSVMIGGLLGLVFPMCECGIIPVMRRLIRKGLPLSCCVAYILAGPIINVVVLGSTFVAFTPSKGYQQAGTYSYQISATWMMFLRAGVGYVIAVTTALIVDRLYQKHGNALLTPLATPPPEAAKEEEKDEKEEARRPFFKRLSNISETALHDFIDITVFLCLGALLAATIKLRLDHNTIAQLSENYAILTILLMMGIAVALCLCSEADAFVAASFTKMAPSAKLAFLVLGPMLDFKLYFMYTRVFRPRLIWTIFSAVVIQVFLYSVLLHWYWTTFEPAFMAMPGLQKPGP